MSSVIEAEAVAEMQCDQQKGYRTESESVSVGASSCSSSEEDPLPEINNLIKQVVEARNMTIAYKRVCANKGAPGIDGRAVGELKGFLTKHWARVKQELLSGTYKPTEVLRVEIPKPSGGIRPLGIPTVLDRLIQQAIHQVLSPIFELEFSDHSYGFRPKRSAKQALKAAECYRQQGKRIVVDMDLKSFFDEVNHDILMGLLRRRIQDKALLKLIRSYLNNGIMSGGIVSMPVKGTPQGGPLSPLLSNIILTELDRELEKRGHSFCRYADDCNIYVSSKRAGQRVFESVARFVETKLKLKVNYKKSAVDFLFRRKFLGFSFTNTGKISIAKESRKRFTTKVKELCRIGRGRNLEQFIVYNLNPYLKGWFNYFKLAESKKTFAKEMDKWIRHRLRNIVWRQWKRPRTRRKKLISFGLKEERASTSAYNGRGPWWNSGQSHMNQALPNKLFKELGLYSLLENC